MKLQGFANVGCLSQCREWGTVWTTGVQFPSGQWWEFSLRHRDQTGSRTNPASSEGYRGLLSWE